MDIDLSNAVDDRVSSFCSMGTCIRYRVEHSRVHLSSTVYPDLPGRCMPIEDWISFVCVVRSSIRAGSLIAPEDFRGILGSDLFTVITDDEFVAFFKGILFGDFDLPEVREHIPATAGPFSLGEIEKHTAALDLHVLRAAQPAPIGS